MEANLRLAIARSQLKLRMGFDDKHVFEGYHIVISICPTIKTLIQQSNLVQRTRRIRNLVFDSKQKPR